MTLVPIVACLLGASQSVPETMRTLFPLCSVAKACLRLCRVMVVVTHILHLIHCCPVLSLFRPCKQPLDV